MDLTNQKFNRLTVIEKTNKRQSGSIVWKCKCDCGNIVEVSARSLRSGNTKSCGCLNNEKRIANIRKYNQEHQSIFPGMQFNELTTLEPTDHRDGSNVVWKCKCSCGKICYVNTSNLKTQKSCGHVNNFHYKDLTNQKFGRLTALEPTLLRQNGNVVWKCKCDCGNICYKGSKYLINGMVQSCGCLKSKGEQKIINILQQNNIDFKKEVTFSDCKYNDNLLRFDFGIYNNQNELLYLIEYDGIQHFEQTGWEDLSILQERDKIKNNWCKSHNIPLIRIPYLRYDELILQDLQLQTSNFTI